MTEIAIEPQHKATLTAILQQYLPSYAHVWVFGSRATGNAKPFSDIDLLIDTGVPCTLAELSKLTTAFEESLLPYKVDIVDRHTISKEFYQHIQSQLIGIL